MSRTAVVDIASKIPRLQTFILAAVLLFAGSVGVAVGQGTVPVTPQEASIAAFQTMIGAGGSFSATAILGAILWKVWGQNEKQTAQFLATLKELADGWKEERKELIEIITEHTGKLDRLLGAMGRRSGDSPTTGPSRED